MHACCYAHFVTHQSRSPEHQGDLSGLKLHFVEETWRPASPNYTCVVLSLSVRQAYALLFALSHALPRSSLLNPATLRPVDAGTCPKLLPSVGD